MSFPNHSPVPVKPIITPAWQTEIYILRIAVCLYQTYWTPTYIFQHPCTTSPLHAWVRGSKWHTASHSIDELWPSSLTLCCHLTSHVLHHSYPHSAALEETKNIAQSKWFTFGSTQHIDPSKLLLNASPEGLTVLYCTAISEATELLLFYRLN